MDIVPAMVRVATGRWSWMRNASGDGKETKRALLIRKFLPVLFFSGSVIPPHHPHTTPTPTHLALAAVLPFLY